MLSKITGILIFFICLQKSFAQNQTAIIRRVIQVEEIAKADSVAIVSVKLPPFSNITIKENTVAILKKNYANDKNNIDTTIAIGKCKLIKENEYYFTMKLQQANLPENKDVLIFKAIIPTCYEGLLYSLSNNGIELSTLEEKEFYNIETPYLLKNKEEEEKYLLHMVSDIQYTGKEMEKQLPDKNNVLKDGLYKNVRLFTAMQKTKLTDLKEFLKYMKARPNKYAAQTWKISEIYATWLSSSSPMVVESKQ